MFNINLPPDTVVTLSTLSGQAHSVTKDIPESQLFPTPYKDDFESKELATGVDWERNVCLATGTPS